MRTLAIVAGASHWPTCPTLATKPQFLRSAELLADLFLAPDGLHLRRSELYWLFENDRPADQLDDRLGEWLDGCTNAEAFEGPPTDLIFYYVGHGHIRDGEFFLTLRSTREENIEQSSWSVRALARTLRDHAGKIRKHIVLDCCFAGAAVTAFQLQDPGGTALLCAANRTNVADAPDSEFLTSFSASFIDAIARGLPQVGHRLSLSDIHRAMHDDLKNRNRALPCVFDPALSGNSEVQDGRVSGVPIFPNRDKIKPATTETLRRELYRRLLELESQFKARMTQRLEVARSEIREAMAMQGRSVVDEMKGQLDAAAWDLKAQVDAAAKEAFRAADKRARRRSFTLLAGIISLICALVAIAVAKRLLHTPGEASMALDPALGWQSSGVRVKQGDRSCIRADGRINLGLNQVVNVMNVAKPIVSRFAAEGTKTKDLAQEYHEEKDFSEKIFRRPWSGPDGVELTDSLLDDARLDPSCRWAELLVMVLGADLASLASRDPLAIVAAEAAQIEVEVTCVGIQLDYVAPRTGTLIFIVNDAVNSKAVHGRERSAELFDAFARAADVLPRETAGRQAIEKESIPLFWYADNGGQISVRVLPGPCP